MERLGGVLRDFRAILWILRDFKGFFQECSGSEPILSGSLQIISRFCGILRDPVEFQRILRGFHPTFSGSLQTISRIRKDFEGL